MFARIMSRDLRRFTTSGDDGKRVYTDEEDLFLPSVTTVLDEKPTPDGIKYWKQKYDGTDGKKHWRDILNYKSNRGTLIHYNLLNEFEDGDMFGTNEEDSKEGLKLEGNWNRYQDDLIFAEDAWKEIKEVRGISDERVLDVECFVTNVGVGYAGQFDLLYVDTDGNLTLSDLKTGKGIYDKYKMQLTAYDNALELPIDQLEIIRIHPDSETWEVSHDEQWSESRRELWADFMELRMEMGDVEAEFRQVMEDGIDDG